MKRRMIAAVLPIVAGLGLAGTGFGAWVFSNNVSSASAGANINITAAYNISGVKVETVKEVTVDGKKYSGNSITLDQGEEADMYFGYKISVTGEEISGLTETVNNPNGYNSTSVTYNDATSKGLDTTKNYQISYSCNVNVTLSGASATYLTVASNGSRTISDTMTLTYDETKGWVSSSALSDETIVTLDWNSKSVHTAEGTHTSSNHNAKPQCMDEYKAMLAAFKDTTNPASIVVALTNFTASEIVAVAK